MHELVVHLHHLVGRHPVACDLEGKIVGIVQLARHAVAQITQNHEVLTQGRPDFFGRFPDGFAFCEVIARVEQIIDFIRCDRLPVELELEAVEERCLSGLRQDAPLDERRISHRAFAGVQQHLVQLAHGKRIQLCAVPEQFARFANDSGIAIERGISFAGRLRCRVVCRGYIPNRVPLRDTVDLVKRLVARVDEGEKLIGPILD